MQFMAQVAQALEVAHERGIVHRDLKPGNVMIGPRGLVKVLDFGLAKRTYGLSNLPPPRDGAQAAGWATAMPGQGASLSGPVAGTPGYMSPEQVLAGTQDSRTDVFAFGCVLYECLTGHRAFPADDPFVAMAQVLNETPDLALLPPRTPPPRARDAGSLPSERCRGAAGFHAQLAPPAGRSSRHPAGRGVARR